MNGTWEDEAENWIAWTRSPQHDVYRVYSPAFFDEMVPDPSGLTLEVGCGEGRVTRDLRDRGHEVVGLDPSPTLVKAAQHADVAGTYVNGNGEFQPFGEGTFEVVVAYNSLQNVDDLTKTIREIARVLKPSGKLCACIAHPASDAGRFQGAEATAPFVINGSYYGPRRIDEKVEQGGLEMTFHGWAYSLEEYTRALEQSGLAIDLIREPRPSDAAVARRPSLARWQRLPLFMFFRAEKRAGSPPESP